MRQVFKLDKPATTSSPGNGLPTTTKPQLQFVSNVNTGTLLVQGATADELQKIRELIELYDQPETLASYEVFHLEHASPFAVELKLLDVFKPEGRTGSGRKQPGDRCQIASSVYFGCGLRHAVGTRGNRRAIG